MGEMVRPTLEQLRKANAMHRRELRMLRMMSESQFSGFKNNFSFGHLENLTRQEAIELLTSMLTLNLQIQSEIKGPTKE